MKQNKFWLKLAGVAILVHIVLIIISILEVAFYSYLVNPGKDEAFYSQHANESGPWVSGIGGFILMFYLVRWYVERFSDRQLTYAIMLPVIYTATDILILTAAGVSIMDHITQTGLANGAKLLGALSAYFLYRNSKG